MQQDSANKSTNLLQTLEEVIGDENSTNKIPIDVIAYHDLHMRYYLTIVYSLFLFIGCLIFLSNTVVIVTITKMKKVGPSLSIVVLCSFFDSCIGIRCILKFLVSGIDPTYEIFPQNGAWCWSSAVLMTFAFLGSVFSMTLLSIDRYIKIIHPHSVGLKMKHVLISGAAIVIFTLTFSLLPVITPWNESFKIGTTDEFLCIMGPYHRSYGSVTAGLCFFAIFTSIGLYMKIYVAVQKSQRIKAKLMMNSSMGSNGRALQTTAFVVGTFVLLWLPQAMYVALVSIPDNYTLMHFYRFPILSMLITINSLINPLIYMTRIPMVRSRIKDTFFCKCKSQVGVAVAVVN